MATGIEQTVFGMEFVSFGVDPGDGVGEIGGGPGGEPGYEVAEQGVPVCWEMDMSGRTGEACMRRCRLGGVKRRRPQG